MKAVICRSLTGADGVVVVDDAPEPEVRPGDVVVEVSAVALNFMDTLIVKGRYQQRPEPPFSPGAELAGRVVALGPGADRFAVGDRVAGYVGYGAARARLSIPQEQLIAIPDAVDDAVASGIHVTYGTALYAFKDRAQLAADDVVAITGASGGAGLAAVEIAHMLGARVIAIASTDDKLAVCKAHGADTLIKSADCDLKQALRDTTGGDGPNVIYDCVGGDLAEPALRGMARAGRYLIIGFAGGDIPKLPANIIMLKDADVKGIDWGGAARSDPRAQAARMSPVLQWIAEGRLKPRVHQTRPLDEAADGIRDLAERRAVGKVVLTV